MLDYDATPDGVMTTVKRLSRNVSAHRHWGAAQAPATFTVDFEAMADLEGDALEAQKARYVRGTSKEK